jgi:hypothetical protein
MVNNPVWEICEHVAEVQVPLDDHLAGGKHSAVDVVARSQAVLTEAAATGRCSTSATSRRTRRRGPELRRAADRNGGVLGNKMSVPLLASMRGASVGRLRCQPMNIPDQTTSPTRRQNRAS